MQFWDKEKTLSSICGLEIDDYVYLVDEIAIAVAPELYPDEPKID